MSLACESGRCVCHRCEARSVSQHGDQRCLLYGISNSITLEFLTLPEPQTTLTSANLRSLPHFSPELMMSTSLRLLPGPASHLLCALLLLLPGCGRKEGIKQSPMGTDVPVSVATVKRQKLASSLSLVGNINASADVNVIAETQGTVKAVLVKVGTPCPGGDDSGAGG